jgi:hypothetical protein
VKIFRIFHGWSLFRPLARGSWSGNLPVVWKITWIFHGWSLFGRPTYGSWSGNLSVVWKITRISHGWFIFRRPASGSWSDNLSVVWKCCDVAVAQINYPNFKHNTQDSIEQARGRSHEKVLSQIFMLYVM